MKFEFHRKRISGIRAIVPRLELAFVDDMRQFDFSESRSLRLKEVMGFDKHRVVEDGVCASDLAVYLLESLFREGLIARDGIDALVVVTQSPDYFMPPTSNVIQGRLGLGTDIICLDLNQGCAGFIIGVMQACMLLEQPTVRAVAVVNVDVLSRKTSRRDRNSFPLIGDAGSVTLVEKGETTLRLTGEIRMDGARSDALAIPAGGFRLPSSAQTAMLEDAGDGNWRAKDHLMMNGTAVFNFVQKEVPGIIEDVLRDAGVGWDEVEYLVCHQPNKFMLQKLADKLKVPHSKVPMNIVERFGNSSGVTIPMAIVTNLQKVALSRACRTCIAGFGVGLTWGAMLTDIGRLSFCDLIEYP